MAVAYIQEFPIGDRTTSNYDFMADKIGDGPFEGLIVHTAGYDDEAGVFRILDVWETPRGRGPVHRRTRPAHDRAGPEVFPAPQNFTEPTRDGFYDLHHVVR